MTRRSWRNEGALHSPRELTVDDGETRSRWQLPLQYITVRIETESPTVITHSYWECNSLSMTFLCAVLLMTYLLSVINSGDHSHSQFSSYTNWRVMLNTVIDIYFGFQCTKECILSESKCRECTFDCINFGHLSKPLFKANDFFVVK